MTLLNIKIILRHIYFIKQARMNFATKKKLLCKYYVLNEQTLFTLLKARSNFSSQRLSLKDKKYLIDSEWHRVIMQSPMQLNNTLRNDLEFRLCIKVNYISEIYSSVFLKDQYRRIIWKSISEVTISKLKTGWWHANISQTIISNLNSFIDQYLEDVAY